MESKKVLSKTSIAEFYSGKSILITGATGFMGKVMVEKLLRDCKGVECIYILVRMKRGVDPYHRYQSYVEDIIFDRVRQAAPEQLSKIRLIKGDIGEENLDIDPEDVNELVNKVNVLFHLAAKAKFSLTLREALHFNTVGTLSVLQLAVKCKNLLAFHYVSTSYCLPNQRVFEERYYPAVEEPYTVIKWLKSSDESLLDDAEPRLMKGYPNTYALSKILAEDLVHSFKEKLPIVITRPSIVTSAWNEPYPGYVDGKKSGLAGILLTRGRGVLRTLYSDPNNPLEIIPADIANNAILALTCKRALMTGDDVLFCNLTNSSLQKWNLQKFFDCEMEVVREYPLDLTVWWPYCPLTSNKFYYEYRRLFYHKIPAYFGDFWIRAAGEKPLLVIYQKKFDTAMKTLGFYNTRDFVWKNEQFRDLPDELSPEDREIFFCDFKAIDMKLYAKNQVLGTRKYIQKLNDDDSLQFRRGLLRLFWHLDRFARIVFYLFLLLLVIVIFMLFYDKDYLLETIVDVYYSAKFLIKNNLVIRRGVIARCNSGTSS